MLDSYDAERRPVFASTMRDFIARSIEVDRAFFESHDPVRDPAGFETSWQARAKGAVGEVLAFEPHYEGSPLLMQASTPESTPSAVGTHRFDARAGHHLAPAMLDSGSNVFDEIGPAFTLLNLGADSGTVDAFTRAAGALSIPLRVLSDPATGGASRYDAAVVVVRPDHFVAWSGGEEVVSESDASEILRRSTGRPS